MTKIGVPLIIILVAAFALSVMYEKGEYDAGSRVEKYVAPISCPDAYDPVCGMPSASCDENGNCLAILLSPRTYRSLCEMEKERASLRYLGECGSADKRCPLGSIMRDYGPPWGEECARVY